MRRRVPGLGCILAVALLLPAVAHGDFKTSDLEPDFVHLQYAGQSGLMSLGMGYAWWHRKVQASASYGYVPPVIADRRVHVFSQKNTLAPLRLRLNPALDLRPAVGVATNISLGNKYQVILPPAQRDYYWPDGLYFWVFSGARVDYKPAKAGLFNGFGGQIEVGTINQYLKSYDMNQEVGLGDILSLALSAQLFL
jgi:hypothetical protein